MSSISGQRDCWTLRPRGPALRLSTRALRLFACPEHPFRGENDLGTSSRPDAFTFARRRTLVAPHGVSSAAPSRCFESTSTTDVSRHEHPFVEERRLRRLSSKRRGKTRRRSASRTFRERCCHLASRDGAGPPCGHPASSGLVLDGTLPASGRSVTTLVRSTGGRAPEPCQLAEAPPNRPSDTSRGAWKGTQSARFPVAWPRSSRRTSMSPTLSGAEVPSVAQDQHGPPLRAVRVELCSAGRRSFRRTCSSMFENTD